MKWEKVRQEPQVGLVQSFSGPGKRWGHTLNAVKGGRFLYLFGGYGKDNCQTNQLFVFDTARQTWSQPITKGTPPPPRDSHTSTTVGDNLYVFGGSDGTKTLSDLYILDTSSHTWKCPRVRGEGPPAREGHTATLIGRRLFVFGGCSKFSTSAQEIYYNDLYILNTETFMWKLVVTIGNPPSARDSHSCSSWKSNLIIIGGEDGQDYYRSDVHILDTDSFIWRELNTSGTLLTPRAGHVAVSIGRSLFVYGGFTDAENLHEDLYVLDVDTGVWSKVLTTGEGPCARFSSAGACLDPYKAGFLVIVGGCNKNLDALDDMYYLHTGLGGDARFDQNAGRLSLKKQLKLKCREQSHASTSQNNSLGRINMDQGRVNFGLNTGQSDQGRVNSGLNTGQSDQGKIMFEARVTESSPTGYTLETLVNGQVLRGILFSTKRSSNLDIDQILSRKRPAMPNGDQDNRSKITRALSKDQADATGSKDPPSNGVEAGIGPIRNPLGININVAAVGPNETEAPVSVSDVTTEEATRLNMVPVNAGPTVPQINGASLETRNAITIDVSATQAGPGESYLQKQR